MSSDKLSAGLTGVSGEYFVAGELSRRGYVASITLRNTRGIDILVSNSDAHSLEKLGREANLFETTLSYDGIYDGLKKDQGFFSLCQFVQN